MDGVTIVTHPLVQHKLTLMREKDLSTKGFRQLMNEIGILLAYEVTRDLPREKIEMLTLVPSARVAHIGLYRDPETLTAVEYYFKAPSDIADRLVIVLDPMLATANSAIAAIDRLKERGVKDLRFVCLLAAPEGIKNFRNHHPDVPIWTVAVDSHLNDHGYIVPGLGDAGDRMYGTK